MPSEAQLSRVGVISSVGKVANKAAVISERVSSLEARPVPALCCGLWNSLNIAIPSAAWTAVTFDTAQYDGYSMYAAGTPSRITCVAPGKYIVSACVKWAASVSHASGAGVRLYANGATVFAEDFWYSSDRRAVTITGMVHLAAQGEYVEVYVQQNTGAPVNLLSAADYSPTLAMHKYG